MYTTDQCKRPIQLGYVYLHWIYYEMYQRRKRNFLYDIIETDDITDTYQYHMSGGI